MDIRFARTEDIPGMLRLLQQVGLVHHNGRPDLFRPDAQKYDEAALLALLKDPVRPIFIADEGGAVLGYAFCIRKVTENNPVLNDWQALYIDDLCVDENCRGKSIGTALYQAVKAYAKAEGYRSITLNVWAFNESAMAFYRKCGLKPQKIEMESILEDSTC